MRGGNRIRPGPTGRLLPRIPSHRLRLSRGRVRPSLAFSTVSTAATTATIALYSFAPLPSLPSPPSHSSCVRIAHNSSTLLICMSSPLLSLLTPPGAPSRRVLRVHVNLMPRSDSLQDFTQSIAGLHLHSPRGIRLRWTFDGSARSPDLPFTLTFLTLALSLSLESS